MTDLSKDKPYILEEDIGPKFYCACGQSKNMPYCDGSHKGTDKMPYKVNITEKKKVAICSCGKSQNMPYCDGSHLK